MGTEHKVVLVDDNELMRILTGRTLAEAGYRVVTVDNPFEAPRVIHQERPALVLLDVQMPGLSGPRLLEICKGQEHFKQTIFFFYSALDRGSLLELTLSSGAHGFIQKPWSHHIFLQRVNEGIERYERLQAQRELPESTSSWSDQQTSVNGFSTSFTRSEEGSAFRFTRSNKSLHKVNTLVDELEIAHANRDAQSVQTLASELRTVQKELNAEDSERLEVFLELFGY